MLAQINQSYPDNRLATKRIILICDRCSASVSAGGFKQRGRRQMEHLFTSLVIWAHLEGSNFRREGLLSAM